MARRTDAGGERLATARPERALQPVNASTPRPTRRPLAAAAFTCVALIVAAYGNFFQNSFQFDDDHVLVNNAFMRSLANAPQFFADARTFSSLPANQTYRPLVSVSLALDHALAGGLSPVVFHASQLVLLLGLWALLAAFFARVMNRASPHPANRYLALFAATLFCVHVVNTETMNLMHARSEIMSTAGILAAFLVYWSGRVGRPRRWLALLPVAVGALAKIPAVLFAPLLFAWEYLLPPAAAAPARLTDGRARLAQAARAAAPAATAAVVLYVFVERVMRVPLQTYGGTSAYHYALTQAWTWVHYLRLYFLPVGLSADTDLGLIQHWYDTRVVTGVVVIAALAEIVRRNARHGERWPIAFGVAWFMIALLPASSFLPLAEPMNEHRAFVAHIGLTLAVTWAARLALRDAFARRELRPSLRKAGAFACCGVVLGSHAIGVHVRNRVWRTDESLWADVTAKSPQNGRAWMNYGVALMARARWQPAKAAFERAEQLTPGYSYVAVNLGVLTGSLGDVAAAERHFKRGLELGPADKVAYDYYARWLVKQGRAEEAIPLLEKALGLAPSDEAVRGLLMDLRAARGDDSIAAALARELLAWNPEDARARAYASGALHVEVAAGYDALVQRGRDLGTKEQYVESALAYRAALKLDDAGFQALNNLGWTLGKLGFFAQAVPVLERAVIAAPNEELARNNLAWVKQNLR